jgi:hypothetical protein
MATHVVPMFTSAVRNTVYPRHPCFQLASINCFQAGVEILPATVATDANRRLEYATLIAPRIVDAAEHRAMAPAVVARTAAPVKDTAGLLVITAWRHTARRVLESVIRSKLTPRALLWQRLTMRCSYVPAGGSTSDIARTELGTISYGERLPVH